MLQNIRQHLHGWVTWLLLGLITFAFMLFGVQYYLQSRAAERTSATVNGEKISQQQVQQAFRRLQRNMQAQVGDEVFTPKMSKQLKKQARKELIDTVAMHQLADKYGFAVSRKQAEAIMSTFPIFQEEGQFSPERYQAALSQLNYTSEGFIKDLQTKLVLHQLQAGVTATSFITIPELNNLITLLLQKRDFNYLVIDAKKQKANAKISEKAIADYYEKNKKTFVIPEKVSIQYLTLSQKDILKHIKITAEQVKEYYENNQATFQYPAKWRVAHILFHVPKEATEKQIQAVEAKAQKIEKEIKAGKAFAALAKKYSDDPISGKAGGKLNWFTMGSLDPLFENAVQTLKKPGDVSAPVRTKYGIEIIQLIGHQPIKRIPLKNVKTRIEQTLKQLAVQKEFAEKSEQLSELSYSETDSLNAAASALKLPIQTSGLFDRQGTKTGISANPKIFGAAFTPDVLVQRYNSHVLQLDTDEIAVLRIKEHVPARQQKLKEVKTAIVDALQQQAKFEAANRLAKTMLTQLREKKDITTLLKQHQLKWQHAKLVARHQKAIDHDILKAAFSLPEPTEKTGVVAKLIKLKNGDAVLIRLNKIVVGNESAISIQQINFLKQKLAEQYGNLDYSLYTKHIIDKADIAIHE